jgi:hypothetical protein
MQRRTGEQHSPDLFDRTWPKILRLSGLGIALYETAIDKVDRPSLLILAAGMMGLQNVLDFQKKKSGGGE